MCFLWQQIDLNLKVCLTDLGLRADISGQSSSEIRKYDNRDIVEQLS